MASQRLPSSPPPSSPKKARLEDVSVKYDSDEDLDEYLGQVKKSDLPLSPPPSVPSSPKKAQVEDVSVGVSEYHPDSDSDDEDLKEYLRQFKESDGFDVQDFPNSRWMCMMRPIDDLNDKFFAKQLKQCVDLALTQYNTQQGTKLEFVKYLKANWHLVSGIEYYITFEVKDADAETKVFQARVWLGITETKVVICRPKKQ